MVKWQLANWTIVKPSSKISIRWKYWCGKSQCCEYKVLHLIYFIVKIDQTNGKTTQIWLSRMLYVVFGSLFKGNGSFRCLIFGPLNSIVLEKKARTTHTISTLMPIYIWTCTNLFSLPCLKLIHTVRENDIYVEKCVSNNISNQLVSTDNMSICRQWNTPSTTI